VIAMQSSRKSLVRWPNNCSAAEPDGPTAAGSGGLDKNDPEAPPNDPETEPNSPVTKSRFSA